MKILSVEQLAELVNRHGLENFLKDLIQELTQDFKRWEEFKKVPRPAMHVEGGVLELMPICDNTYYSFKYVNCHPKNPESGLMTVVATGQLARIDTGYPVMISEMTLLTALRTAATTALATKLLSKKNSRVLAIIGTGAQSEFLAKAICLVRNINEIRYFDIDSQAMDKFRKNLESNKFKLVQCQSSEEVVRGADIITTCTACKDHVDVIKNDWVKEGVHINGIGGDCPGKTELEFSILKRSRIVVEYFEQSCAEGEIQRFSKEDAQKNVYAELYELVKGTKVGRSQSGQITLYDSVGIALEDYSALKLAYRLANKYNLGENINLTPNITNPKNLISVLTTLQEKKLALQNNPSDIFNVWKPLLG
jgi:ornithine cyclodeaminase